MNGRSVANTSSALLVVLRTWSYMKKKEIRWYVAIAQGQTSLEKLTSKTNLKDIMYVFFM
jgi:hypothetical protein